MSDACEVCEVIEQGNVALRGGNQREAIRLFVNAGFMAAEKRLPAPHVCLDHTPPSYQGDSRP